MKTIKTKLHRKSSKVMSSAMKMSAECWALEHDHPDPDLQFFSLERSPKQENL